MKFHHIRLLFCFYSNHLVNYNNQYFPAHFEEVSLLTQHFLITHHIFVDTPLIPCDWHSLKKVGLLKKKSIFIFVSFFAQKQVILEANLLIRYFLGFPHVFSTIPHFLCDWHLLRKVFYLGIGKNNLIWKILFKTRSIFRFS